MSKDPAFLFYHEDFFAGVSDMSNEEVGAYIRCMCVQASKSGITEKHMKKICETSDVYMIIINKFVFNTETSLFQNKRLLHEVEKRKAYSKSRSNNRSSKKTEENICKSYDKHMENVNENEYKDKGKGFVGEKPLNQENAIPEWAEFLAYGLEKEPSVDHSALNNKYDAWVANDWKDGNNTPIKNWKSKLLHTMPHIKKIKSSENGKLTEQIRAKDPRA